ncbi:GSCFA domain-containing protein [Celeribacter indicus]|uniref:GSCFA domain-containing protein n=1 Tax=Celeribacter indicus TaxID=1208324 RepID=A0A0B5DQY1_9RHOB|nr:GSCFA domain-containing protein [Celeribacter indicus]AJE45938.1 hypothetical protein P73_1223 [Celeribacter indicus]SDW64214.1 GSCFA family protein [Celeribacter indicus]
MGSPYDHLPSRAFWRSGVALQPPEAIEALFVPKFAVGPDTRIVTAGGGLSQHLHRALANRGWTVTEAEPAPEERRDAEARDRELSPACDDSADSLRHMLRRLREATGEIAPAGPVRHRDGRAGAPQPPNRSPAGGDSPETMRPAQADHLAALRGALADADLFVLTLGPAAMPEHGTAGDGPAAPAERAPTLPELRADLAALRALLTTLRPGIRLLLMLSPVPPAAAADMERLSAATHATSVLRAAAGEFAAAHEDVDYAPAFELLTGPAAGNRLYDPDLRRLTPAGISAATRMVLTAYETIGAGPA